MDLSNTLTKELYFTTDIIVDKGSDMTEQD